MSTREQQLKVIEEALSHKEFCRKLYGAECQCGYEAAKAALAALRQQEPPAVPVEPKCGCVVAFDEIHDFDCPDHAPKPVEPVEPVGCECPARKALRDLRDEVSAGMGDDGREELKPMIHHDPVLAADQALSTTCPSQARSKYPSARHSDGAWRAKVAALEGLLKEAADLLGCCTAKGDLLKMVWDLQGRVRAATQGTAPAEPAPQNQEER
jgi:hypothetical protein